MLKDATFWIKNLKLFPHPEGGYYTETYKSGNYKITDAFNISVSKRKLTTLIYFLLKGNEFSAFHRLKSDEIWIYHQGCSAKIYIIDDLGQLSIENFGSQIENGEKLQVLIPANSWFAAELNDQTSFCLMSCMVAPGFVWTEFELGIKNDLHLLYPKYKDLFNRLCKS